MSILAKVFVIINLVFSIAFLSVSGALYHHRTDWRTEFNRIKHKYKEVKERKNQRITQLEEQIEDWKAYVDKMVVYVSNQEAQVERIGQMFRDTKVQLGIETQELALLLNDHSKVVSILRGKDAEIERLTVEVNEVKAAYQKTLAEKNTAENQVSRLTNIKLNLEKDLADLSKEFAKVRRELNEKKLIIAQLEAYGVPVKDIVLLKPPPTIRAVVNAYDKETRMVLLNVGRQDKVQEGYRFTVYRGERFIGRVIVTRVFNDCCGARVKFQVDEILAGDSAATRLP